MRSTDFIYCTLYSVPANAIHLIHRHQGSELSTIEKAQTSTGMLRCLQVLLRSHLNIMNKTMLWLVITFSSELNTDFQWYEITVLRRLSLYIRDMPVVTMQSRSEHISHCRSHVVEWLCPQNIFALGNVRIRMRSCHRYIPL